MTMLLLVDKMIDPARFLWVFKLGYWTDGLRVKIVYHLPERIELIDWSSFLDAKPIKQSAHTHKKRVRVRKDEIQSFPKSIESTM